MTEFEKPAVLVCINEHPNARDLLLAGARIAQERDLRLQVLYVEQPHYYYRMKPARRESILKCLTQAEEMGADIIRLQASIVEQAIDSYTRNTLSTPNPVFYVIMGVPERKHLKSWVTTIIYGRRHDTLSQILDRAITLYAIPLQGDYDGGSLLPDSLFERTEPRELFFSLLSVCAALLVAHTLRVTLPDNVFLLQPQNVSIIFLISVVFVGGRWGMIPALWAALLSHLMMNYLYLEPNFVIQFEYPADLINLALFMIAAVMIALFSSHTRAFALNAIKNEKRTQALYQLQRLTAPQKSHYEALRTMHNALRTMFEMEVAFFSGKKRNEQPQPEYPSEMTLNEESQEALNICWRDGITTGMGSMFSGNSEWRFEPMRTSQGMMGVFAVRITSFMHVDSSFGRVLTAVADQCASILQRISLEHHMEQTKITAEKEKLRSMLLSAVSHDLKTPLASIIGSLSVYHTMFDRLSLEHRTTLTMTALEEAQRLDRFITNILDMTRLESGQVKFKMEWQDPIPLVKRVCKRMRLRLQGRELRLQFPKEPVSVKLDTLMTEQLLQNLVDNAIKYSPAGTAIEISTALLDSEFILSVRDYGKGIPDAMRDRIFDKYERLHKEDAQVAGTGLGLAICRAIAEHMDGRIQVCNHSQGGAVFSLRLPEVKLGKEDTNTVIQESIESEIPLAI